MLVSRIQNEEMPDKVSRLATSLFGISFDSRGKRNFFPKPLFLLFLLKFFQQILLKLDRQIVVRVQLVNLLWRNCVHQPL